MTRFRTLFAAAALALSGCFVVTGPQHVDHDRKTFDGDVLSVAFDVGAGDLTVRVGDVPAPEVQRTIRWSGEAPPDALAVLDADGTLVLDVDCSGTVLQSCSVDHEVVLPAGAVIQGFTGAGDIRLEGTGDLVDVETGAGDVWVEDATRTWVRTGAGDVRLDAISGKLTLDTGSGNISGTQLSGGTGVVDTGAGDVDLAWVSPPAAVDVDTRSGNVDLSVPPGSYRVDIDTGSGNVSVEGLVTDPEAEDRITVSTGAGDVRIFGS